MAKKLTDYSSNYLEEKFINNNFNLLRSHECINLLIIICNCLMSFTTAINCDINEFYVDTHLLYLYNKS